MTHLRPPATPVNGLRPAPSALEGLRPCDLCLDKVRGDDRGRILTSTGRYLDPLNPDPKDLDIRDIAAGLAKACRYAGQLPDYQFYSVAQHSVRVSRRFSWPYDRMNALLHDAEEAYLGDMASPIKKSFPELKAAGDKLRLAIIDKFSVAFNPEDGLCEFIHEADDAEYRLERQSFWPGSEIDPALKIRAWSPLTAECEFLREFHLINNALEDLKDGR